MQCSPADPGYSWADRDHRIHFGGPLPEGILAVAEARHPGEVSGQVAAPGRNFACILSPNEDRNTAIHQGRNIGICGVYVFVLIVMQELGVNMKFSLLKMGLNVVLGCIGCLAVTMFASDPPASNWPQWRGPAGQGVSDERNLPEEWSATQNVLWKSAIEGRGHSCPVVWGDRLFLTTSIEGPQVPGHMPPKHVGWKGEPDYVHPDACCSDRKWTLKVLCIDTKSGKILWDKTAYEGPAYDDRNRKNTYASGTPVTDGKHVWAFFDAEGLYCYDLGGKLVWKASVGQIAKGGMGYGTSPVIWENLIILQCDQELGQGSFIAALDKRTGKEVWRVPRQHRRSWATPLLLEVAGHAELIASGAETVISYDPATGKEIWRCKGTVSHPIPSAVAGNGMVFFSAGNSAKRAFAVKLGGTGDLTDTPYVVWEYGKGTAYVPSPVFYKDYLYLMTDKGLVTCLEGSSGKVMYEGGRVPVPATFTASAIAYEDKILLSSEDGDVFVLRAGPKHEILRTNSIGEPIFASPAISQGRIYIRGEKNLYCIAKTPAASR